MYYTFFSHVIDLKPHQLGVPSLPSPLSQINLVIIFVKISEVTLVRAQGSDWSAISLIDVIKRKQKTDCTCDINVPHLLVTAMKPYSSLW